MIKNLKIYGTYEDFKKIFLEFRKSPYYEDWNEKNILEEYNYLMSNGDIYVKEYDNKIVGLVSLLNGIQKDHDLKLPTNEVGYMSDIAVLEEYRKRGIGTELMSFAIDEFKSRKFKYCYFRTICNGSLSEPIGKKLGYQLVYNNDGTLLTQEVSFPRVNNLISEVEKRKFLIKQLEENETMKRNYKIYIPSGNPTALVDGIVNNQTIRTKINDEIMKENDIVEQVGFINKDINNPKLIMAGGEFCGNATRSAIYSYLNGKSGNIEIKVSGVKDKLNGGIDDLGNTWVNMPIIKGDFSKSVTKINNKSAIVKLYGITHLIVETKDINLNYSKEELKEIAFKILKENYLTNEDAAGVMFIEHGEDGIKLTPIVYVKLVNTLFYETACGSGTTAVGIYESFKNKKCINENIIQPSNEIINVQTDVENNQILNAKISGKVYEYQKEKQKIKGLK